MATRPAELKDVHHGRRRSRLRLLAPLRYLSIYHPEKTKYDVWFPAGAAIVLWSSYMWLFPEIKILGDTGLLKFTRDLLVMAVPFLVGALASVAMGTPGEHMDRRPVGDEIFLDGEPLTLRRFVCYLLGYLCFVGLFTLIGVVAAELLGDILKSALAPAPALYTAVTGVGMFAYFALTSILVVTVLWALYFLTDVVNRH